MPSMINIQRRRLLKFAGLTAAMAAVYPFLSYAEGMIGMGNQASSDFDPDVEIELKQEVVDIPIFRGPETRVWKVFGKVLKGPETAIVNHAESYIAPTIQLQKGQKVRIILKNNLPAQSILHWHGLHVPSKMDGNPMYAINQGQTFVYEFKILNRAGFYWYHAHTHSVTAKQVYSGLAGLFIVSDEKEQALDLPKGEYDIALAIQDRTFDDQNQLYYNNNMMQRMQGFLGNQIVVNGQPDYVLPVASRAYRLRLLNGSNSRIYKLAWDDGTPMTVIGVDGGLLERPERHPYIMLAPGERREIWMDFSGKTVGAELTLRSLSFDGSVMGGMHGGMGMMGGMRGRMMGGRHGGMMGGMMMSGGDLPLGGDYAVLKVKVSRQVQAHDKLPERLSAIKPLRLQDAVNAGSPRNILLSMRHMSALLNGRSYAMDDIRDDEIIPVNTLQAIAFNNGFGGGMGMGGMMMSMPHPMHMHGEQFQVLKREIDPGFKSAYESVEAGFVDSGWKDTVLVMPGEKVTVLKPFNDYKGVFMYHCHNLEHEDMGMMRDFLVK
ncbi:multicopper oxidase family protein [Methylobacter sp. YRD-M1]|uniref:multicopper oxidase family protein n=1 Tax=Methylobacter sp. YRD-M1 TaxID=2911520 RepID=UPI00227CA4B1|nr:multicopper oxidase domain-containing protein [Methylobacter sp. YRD-M1]WAK01364.1 multicopper oxidase domain-containing protein [Methylobacter sp. YRD-M1]